MIDALLPEGGVSLSNQSAKIMGLGSGSLSSGCSVVEMADTSGKRLE
jgi:hypothetical protein